MRVGHRWSVYAALGVLLVLLCIAGVGSYIRSPQAPSLSGTSATPSVQLKGETIRVTVADTEQSRERGLGGRESLSPDEGMLFIFPEDGIYPFWMKDMRFPIDILWLSDTGAVVYMAEGVSPNTYPKDFVPEKPSRYVFELPAGWVREHNVQLGDIVRL